MGLQEDKKSLEIFNELVQRLSTGDFVAFITTNRKTNIQITWDNLTKTCSVDTNFPSGDAVDSALLKLRLFGSDSDGFSLRKIEEIYERAPIPQEQKNYCVSLQLVQ